MNVLLTSSSSFAAHVLADGLTPRHELRITDRLPNSTAANYAYCALGHDLATDLLVAGMDAVVHVAEPLEDEAELSYIDYMTRCTYNLCNAMSEGNVGRLVLLHTLDVMAGYDDRYRVTEQWRPMPTDESRLLGKHLGEYVCKEFARERKLSVVVLRMGSLITGKEWQDQPQPDALREDDLVQAVDLALLCELPHWSVFHVASSHSQNKYVTNLAHQTLKFSPAKTNHAVV